MADPPLDQMNAYFQTSQKPQQSTGDDLRALYLYYQNQQAAEKPVRGLTTGYIDNDDSGTYDPNAKRKRSPKIKSYRAQRVRDDDEGEEVERKWRAPIGAGLPMTFSFTSQNGLDFLASLPEGGNWPYDNNKLQPHHPEESGESSEDEDPDSQSTPQSDVDSDQDPESDSESDPVSDSESDPEPKRRRTRPLLQYDTVTKERPDGLKIEDLTPKDEQYHGCKACFYSGFDGCSLFSAPFEWPCQACNDSNCICQPIHPPEFKKVCEPCKRKKIKCSYRKDGGKNKTSCSDCEADNESCLAAPLDPSAPYGQRFLTYDDRRKNVRIHADENHLEIRNVRQYIDCTQCRDKQRRCSLMTKRDVGPCKHCRQDQEECAFVLPSARHFQEMKTSAQAEAQALAEGKGKRKGKRKAQQVKYQGVHKKATDNTKQIYREITRKKRVYPMRMKKNKNRWQLEKEKRYVTIKTSFANPVIFNHEDEAACSFCTIPLFSFFGLRGSSGPRMVRGYWLPSGAGFREVSDGFNSFPDPSLKPENDIKRIVEKATKMCFSCTSSRLRINSCETHTFIPLPKEQLFNQTHGIGLENSDEVQNARYCSLCPHFGAWMCAVGCGLLLCEDCYDLACNVFGIYNVDSIPGKRLLDELIHHIESNTFVFEEGTRADVCFLRSAGELVTRMNAGMLGDGEEDGDGGEEENFTEEEKIKMALEADERAKIAERSEILTRRQGGVIVGAGEESDDHDGAVKKPRRKIGSGVAFPRFPQNKLKKEVKIPTKDFPLNFESFPSRAPQLKGQEAKDAGGAKNYAIQNEQVVKGFRPLGESSNIINGVKSEGEVEMKGLGTRTGGGKENASFEVRRESVKGKVVEVIDLCDSDED